MKPEPYPLTNAYFKTARALVHLDELKAALNSFADSQPYTVTSLEEPEGDAIRYRVEIQHPHVTLFLIAADVLQCLRTALDQAVWSLASLKHSDPDWTEFPIYDEPLDSNSGKRFERKLHGIPDKALAYITSLQPFNRPPGTPPADCLLWQLHELNRIEKHRRILVRSMFTGISRNMPGFSSNFIPLRWEPQDYGCDVICAGAYKALPTLTPIVVFGEQRSGITIEVSGIEQIYEFVSGHVLPTLAGFA